MAPASVPELPSADTHRHMRVHASTILTFWIPPAAGAGSSNAVCNYSPLSLSPSSSSAAATNSPVQSCIALVVSFFSIIAVCCLPYPLQLVAAFFDFGILSGYIASAVLLFNNYHVDNVRNPLWRWLVAIRLAHNQSGRERRSGALVKLLDAGVILMIFLFFLTTLLSFCLAMLNGPSGREEYERASAREEVEEGKHHRRRSRGSR